MIDLAWVGSIEIRLGIFKFKSEIGQINRVTCQVEIFFLCTSLLSSKYILTTVELLKMPRGPFKFQSFQFPKKGKLIFVCKKKKKVTYFDQLCNIS